MSLFSILSIQETDMYYIFSELYYYINFHKFLLLSIQFRIITLYYVK